MCSIIQFLVFSFDDLLFVEHLVDQLLRRWMLEQM